MILRYAKSAGFQLLEKLIRLPVSLLISIYVANHLGPELLGVLNFSHMFILMFLVFSSFGIDNIIYKDLVKSSPPETSKILINAIAIRFFGAILTGFLIAISVVFFIEGKNEKNLILIFSFIIIFSSLLPLDILLQSKGNGKLKSIITLSSFFISTLVKLLIIKLNYTFEYLALAIVLENIVQFLILLIYAKKSHLNFSFKQLDFKFIKALLKDSFPIFLSIFIISIYTKVDTFMIKHFMNDYSVGNYSIAIKLSELTSFVPVVLIGGIFPYIIKLKEKGEIVYREGLEVFLFLIYVVCFLMALFVTLFSESIIDTLYGADYLSASYSLSILCWSTLFQVFGSYTTNWLVNEGLQRYRLYRTVLGLVVNIFLNLILIPKYGISGAAIATLLSQVFASYIGNVISRNTILMFKIQSRVIIFYPLIRIISNFLILRK